MASIIRAVRAKKAPNLGLQRGFSLSGTLQERLFTGSRVLNEVVLSTLVNKVSRKGQSPVGLDATRRRALHPARRPRGTRGPPGSPPRPARRRPGGPRLLRDEASPSVWPRPGRGRRRAARSGLPCRAPRVLARLCA